MPTSADTTPFATLLPPTGWQMDPQTFQSETERNEGFGSPIAWPGFGETITDTIPPVGVATDLRYVLTGTTDVTLNSGTAAATDQWPHGLISRYRLSLNGQATPWNIRGNDLEVLRFARTKAVTQGGEQTTFPTAGGTDALQVQWHIPLALDPALAPSVGGLFAQSVNSTIVSSIQTANTSDVATLTGAATLAINSGTFTREETWYSIPVGKLSDGSTGMILPDLSVLHGCLQQDQTITSTGDNPIYINRVQGTIARVWFRMTNGASSLAPFGGALDQLSFSYASNQRPRVELPSQIRQLNEMWYRGVLPYSAFSIDNIAENLVRDAIDVEALSNPQFTPTIDSGADINAGARLICVYELLAPLA